MKSRFATLVIMILTALVGTNVAEAADSTKKVSLIPQIHGTFRGRWEMDLQADASRFQVRNARLSISGNITEGISYFFQPDLCDRGKMKILDAFGQVAFTDDLNIRVGQFRMPMGVDPFRGPHTYFFANRSVIGKEVDNFRAVGARLSYTLPCIPLLIEAGAFNPTSIGDHNVWCKTLAYSTKARYTLGEVAFTTGFQSIQPDKVRINFVDAAVGWSSDSWTVEGEYIYEHYTHSAHPACHAWNLFADYGMAIKAGIFNTLSFQARYDGMTDHSNGLAGEDGRLVTDNDARNRITVGSTISCSRSKVWCDIRLNYEKYFYHSSHVATDGTGDRLTAELVIRF